jgi:hypothetical protein
MSGDFSLHFAMNALERSGPGGVTSAHPGPDHMEPVTEVHDMADISHYPDSGAAVNMTDKPEQTANVILALRDGFGFEDIQAKNIASADFARAVAGRLTALGLLPRLYGRRG